MDIMSLFRPSTPAPVVPAQAALTVPTGAANPGQALPGTQQTEQTGANGIVPTQSPLDTFKDIWQTPTTDSNKDSGPMFASVDPQKLMESAGKVDFAKVITPAQMAAITAGGEGAVQAFAESMNKVAQSVYAQSAFATTKIVDQATERMQARFDAQLPSLITRHSVNSGLTENNPLLSNPALTPLVSALSEQLVRKNPNASTKEISTQVNDYFAALGASFAPKAPETPASRAANKAAKSEDWTAFLGS